MSDIRDESVESSAASTFVEIIRRQASSALNESVAEVDDGPAPVAPAVTGADNPREEAAARTSDSGVAAFFSGFFRAGLVLPLVAFFLAALFTFALSVQQNRPQPRAAALLPSEAPTPAPLSTPRHLRRIGIVAGHRGSYNDPGAVCADGLTEREVNEIVAEQVVLHLRGLGYHAELLDEFDTRLQNYRATLLLSLHANDCRDYGEHVTGFLLARASARAAGGLDDLLVECVRENYAQVTGLRPRAGVTSDMTEYHSFVEIHPYTPAAILEMGFLLADRRLLTQHSDLVARGVYDGILCFLNEIGA